MSGKWTTEDGKKTEVNLFFNNDYELMGMHLKKLRYKKEDLTIKKNPSLYKFDEKNKIRLLKLLELQWEWILHCKGLFKRNFVNKEKSSHH